MERAETVKNSRLYNVMEMTTITQKTGDIYIFAIQEPAVFIMAGATRI